MTLPQRLKDMFLEQAVIRIAALEAVLKKIKEDPASKEHNDELWQIFHKFHGVSAMYGFDGVGNLCGVIEDNFLDFLKAGKKLSKEHIELFLSAKELIKDSIIDGRTDEKKLKELADQFKNL